MPNNVITIKRYQGTHQARLRSLLQQFTQNIAGQSRQYSRLYLRDQGYLEYGLLTNERGSYSLMAAAMDRITPMHQSEMSVNRRVDYRNPANQDLPRERAGRVDLWFCCDKFEYFMEFKHAFFSPRLIRGCAVPQKVSGPWDKLVNQIAEVNGAWGAIPITRDMKAVHTLLACKPLRFVCEAEIATPSNPRTSTILNELS